MAQTTGPSICSSWTGSIGIFLILLLGIAITACAQNPALYSPGDDQLDAEPFSDFADYQNRARAYLEANLTPVEGFPRSDQVDWNLPFSLPPADHCAEAPETGLLLIHGLSDSPFVFRDLARALSVRCIGVRTLLLQGHGTRPGDMVKASADVWREQVRQQMADLAREVDHLFIGGFSLGGALATEYALSGQQPQVDGIIALAPAWRLNGLDNYLWLAGIADLFADFVEEEPELNPVKYESVTLNAGSQLADVLGQTQRLLEQPAAPLPPLFLVATEADSVIDLGYLVQTFRQRFRHPDNRMLVFRDLRKPWPDNWADPRIQSLDSYLPEENILEFSHQALAIAPDNELYGRGAPLQRCLEPNNLTLAECRKLPAGQLWFSAWHDDPRPVPTSRLTYNPWFDVLSGHMAAFIRRQTPH
ncbi:alpha/beta hydrolase [Marinobacter sp. F4216]|uniref:alpha/beta hydrolase n=1 Tax=Marinobacter sp. F4216 TaxID=2874281 RepID=UPI001CC178D1|nr:alpha/beta fold hydrolase [Marinobacter sp. F4216]MBZ2169423.1 alpha/beta fold hydrolase [Marinobacter sp. F4216]